MKTINIEQYAQELASAIIHGNTRRVSPNYTESAAEFRLDESMPQPSANDLSALHANIEKYLRHITYVSLEVCFYLNHQGIRTVRAAARFRDDEFYDPYPT